MKKCPYCAEEIQEDAIFCKHCQKELVEPQVMEVKKKNSTLGGVGFLLLVLAIVLLAANVGSSPTVGLIVGGVGVVLLVYALATGNIKLFG